MFGTILKWTIVYPTVGVVGLGAAIAVFDSATTKQSNKEFQQKKIEIEKELDSINLEVAKLQEEKKAAEREAEFERQRQEEAKRIAEAAYRNSPEGKTEAFVKQANGLCMDAIKSRAKFPSEVSFNWFEGNGNKYWMNFNEQGDSRVLIQYSGKMMNGFGNMIPFTGVCKYNFNPAKNTYSVVEVLI